MNEAWLADILLQRYNSLSFPSEDATSRLYPLPPVNPIDVDCIDSRFKNPLLPFLLEKRKKKETAAALSPGETFYFAPAT